MTPAVFYLIGAVIAAWAGWLLVASVPTPRHASWWRRATDLFAVRLVVHLVMLVAAFAAALILSRLFSSDPRCRFMGVCDDISPRPLLFGMVAVTVGVLVLAAAERKRRVRERFAYHHGGEYW